MPRSDRSLYEPVQREAHSTGGFKRECAACRKLFKDRSRSRFYEEHLLKAAEQAARFGK